MVWSVGLAQKPELRVPIGHTSGIRSVAFSPDGKYAILGSYAEPLKLWETSSGRLLYSFVGHRGGTTSVVFSPDGRYALSGSAGNSSLNKSIASNYYFGTIQLKSKENFLKLWKVSSGKLLRILVGHNGGVNTVAFSPDSRYALSGANDKTLKLWEISSGKPLRSFVGHTHRVTSVAFSPDGRYALSGSADNTLKLWDITSGKPVRSFSKGRASVESVAFSPDGRYVLSGSRFNSSGSWENRLQLWEISSGVRLRRFVGHSKDVTSVAFSPDGKKILSGSLDKTSKLWSVVTGDLLHTFQGHTNRVSSVAFSSNGRYIFSGSSNSGSFKETLMVWEIGSGKVLRRLEGDTVRTLSWKNQTSPDGRYYFLVTASSVYYNTYPGKSDAFGLIELSSGKMLQKFEGHKEDISSVASSSDWRYALSGSIDGTLKLWEVSSGKPIGSFGEHAEKVTSVALSSDNHYALSGSNDNTLKLWDVNSGKPLHTFIGHTDNVTSVALSRDSRYALSGSEDNTTKIWDTSTGKEIATLIAIDSTDWVVTTPTGLFDASPRAMKLMYYVVNDSTDLEEPWKVIDLEQIRHRYYQPGLLPILLGQRDETPRSVPALDNIPLPPNVLVTQHQNKLIVRLTNRNGGIGQVSVKINGSQLITDLRPKPEKNATAQTLTLTVNLERFRPWLADSNLITVTAFNKEGWVSSRPEQVVVTYPFNTYSAKKADNETVPSDWIFSRSKRPVESIPTSKGDKVPATYQAVPASPQKDLRIGAVVIGASTVGLRYAHLDAEKVGLSLSLVSGRMVGSKNLQLQVLSYPTVSGTREATKKEVIEALTKAQKLSPDDIFILYLSGHGIHYKPQNSNKGDLYYLLAKAQTTDIAAMNDAKNREAYTISFSEIRDYLYRIKARKKLVMLDLCGAGEGLKTLLSEAKAVSGDEKLVLDELRRNTGIYMLASSASNAKSYESPRYQQGLATYAFLRSLRGDGDVSVFEKGNQYISVVRLLDYMDKQVPKLAAEIGVNQQAYFVKGAAPEQELQKDFSIGIVNEAIQRAIPMEETKPVVLVESFQTNTAPRTDRLHLEEQLAAVLDKMSSSKEAPFIFFDAKSYPDAYVLSGEYVIGADAITLTIYLSKNGAVVNSFRYQGKAEQLAEWVAQQVAQRFRK